MPHPEVVNAVPAVLIVGYGHVGQQMGLYFPNAHYVDVDGIIRRVKDNIQVCSLEDYERVGYKYGFICVPTPEGEDGRCDTRIVREAYYQYRDYARYWCIKSTVEVGTCESLGLSVCFSPEYYGETLGHPLAGIQRDPFIILGGQPEVTAAFAELWTMVTNSYARIMQTTARTAEFIKLMENAWIGTKVVFCNQMYELCKLAWVDWNEVREGWLLDPRVSRSHTYVYPHNRGFGGKCIPKDTANLCAWARAQGEPAKFIESVRAYNTELRKRTNET